MGAILQQIEATPALLILAAGVVLIALDIFLTNDTFIAWIGASLLGVGALNAMDLPGVVQLSAFPVLLIACVALIRPLILKTTTPEDQSLNPDDFLGKTASLLDCKDDAPHEGRAIVTGCGEWRVRHVDGKSILKDDVYYVVGRDGFTLLIDRDPDHIPEGGNSQ